MHKHDIIHEQLNLPKTMVFGLKVVHAFFWGFTPKKGCSRMFHAVSRTPLAQLHSLRPSTFHSSRHSSIYFFGPLYQPILVVHSSGCTCAHVVHTVCKPGVTNQIPLGMRFVFFPHVHAVCTMCYHIFGTSKYEWAHIYLTPGLCSVVHNWL